MKRETDNAKWVATIAISVSSACLIGSLIEEYLHKFHYHLFIKYWYSGAIIITIILMSFISIAYFYGVKKASINKQEEAYFTYSPYKRKCIWLIFALISIGSILLNIALLFLIAPEKIP